MDLAAGADALDDLLAEIAALVEVQGLRLVGLLREVLLGDVAAVERASFEEAQGFEGFGRDFGCSCGLGTLTKVAEIAFRPRTKARSQE